MLHTEGEVDVEGEVAKSPEQPSPRCVTSLYYDYTKFKNHNRLISSIALTLGFPIRFDVFCTPRNVLACNLLHLKGTVDSNRPGQSHFVAR